MPQTVRINVHVPLGDWKPLIGPSFPAGSRPTAYTVPVMSLPDGGGNGPGPLPLVSLKPAPEGGQNVRVRGPVTLQFCFPDAAIPDGVNPNRGFAGWRPIGLGFARMPPQLTSADDIADLSRDSTTFGLLPEEAPNTFKIPYVQIVDKWNQHDDPSKPVAWKYTIVIQDCGGNVGIIDPDIENNSSE